MVTKETTDLECPDCGFVHRPGGNSLCNNEDSQETRARKRVINQIGEKLEDLQMWQLRQLLIEIEQASQVSLQPSKCRTCNAPIIWGKTPAGKACPFDWKTGISHFQTCPDANKWKKPKHSPSASTLGQCKCLECKPKLPGLSY